MSIHAKLNHVTHYRYDRPIHLGPQVVRLRPAPHSRTRILSYSMTVEPAKHFINWQQDPQANYLARLVFPDPTTSFRVEVDLVAEMAVYNPFDFFLEPSAEKFPFAYEPELLVELQPYLRKIAPTPLFAQYLERIDRTPRHTNDFLVALNRGLQHDIAYLIRLEHGVQTPEETLEKASGSCRDSAWLLVQLLRHLGLAARFVSGYLIQLKSDVKSLDGPSGTEVDFTDLHAWCEVYLPGAGWIGLDPTSGLLAGEGHIPLACSPEPSSAAPISGTLDPCETTFEHSMTVERIWEAPRVTLPYSDEQWQAIDALGRAVDADLQRGDVRLTQGGEPTFVSVDDREGAEWNTEAMGPTKRALARELLDKLRARYGEGGLVHEGQGKWYPGEPLPRWSLNLFWRRDGVPVWSDPALLGAPSRSASTADASAVDAAGDDAARPDDRRAPTVADGRTLLTRLALRLGIDAGNVFAAYEDAFDLLRREGRLPSNVELDDAHPEGAAGRDRLRRLLAGGLGEPVGHALPIAADERRPGRFRSTPWYLRGDRCVLVPGDSPLGFRLPLESLPWVKASEAPWVHEPDPADAAAPLPGAQGDDDRDDDERPAWHSHDEGGHEVDEREHETPSGTHDLDHRVGADDRPGADDAASGARGEDHDERDAGRSSAGGEDDGDASRSSAGDDERDAGRSSAGGDADRGGAPPSRGERDAGRPKPGESAAKVVRTAMSTELRDGRLHVFMPPMPALDDYLRLVAAVEAVARELDVAPTIEGYEPPKDTRLVTLRVTPDPGVIEVNVQPASNWDALVEQTTSLYAMAREVRLSSEKFMVDGRHTGTGGGNHFVLGGATPADSPFLRRPDLLASMVGYWHNHPALSYLFSGLFVGPTSQAPRIDEARNDSVHEIEVAFAELDRAVAECGGAPPPWLVDRLLRNLLVDVTGNTHRAEFCIDKLFSPDGPTGRLGLLEMRAFEMPPHPRMSLVQQLLMRALVARFWNEPYRPRRLARWGNALHDRFMLPWHVWQDLGDVLRELGAAGYRFDPAWFAAHRDFRFPLLGDAEVAGVALELRMALEPWHVLGEESGAGGTARYVDSTVERIEVRVRGLDGERHLVTCNGRPLPLHGAGAAGEYVAGVRYRAWSAPSSLHPTIRPHVPLVFDVVDTWMARSLGGCQYHVAHPGGVNYVTFPINAYEAEARRLARFFRTGHTPGRVEPARELPNPDFPHTLDLRRPPDPA